YNNGVEHGNSNVAVLFNLDTLLPQPTSPQDMSAQGDNPQMVIQSSPESGEYTQKVFTVEGTPWITFIPNIEGVVHVTLYIKPAETMDDFAPFAVDK
ncbi:hypothetical protein, partial [Xanthovirga aplysinae]|uniref:hypothetical protein n=1 Tax=Xanthovirga aplysinae TaxID=2529853 RepID=UPI0016571A68